jgi:hypothetical protein
VEQSRASWQERSRVFLSDCARLVVSRIGAEAVESVFLCGSLATNEASVVLGEGAPLLLSDVDLVTIVTSLASLRDWSPRRGELGRACEALWPEMTFSGRVDVGLMLREDLGRLPARPGVIDMRSRGEVLWGNPRILDLVPSYAPADITVEEAVILVENRGVALLDARSGREGTDEGSEYAWLYGIARAYTDLAAAALSIDGSYVSGYAARRDLLARRARGPQGGVRAALAGPELLGRIDRWTSFKLEPSSLSRERAMDGESSVELWTEAARDLLFFWRQAATIMREPSSDLSRPLAPEALAGLHTKRRPWRDHLRSWRELLDRLPVPSRARLAGARGVDILSRYPLDIVREEGMRLLDRGLVRGTPPPVRAAKGGYPHRGGSWDAAAAELRAAWSGLVFGRSG